MGESLKDLSTTSFGLIAAYVLPGAIVLAALIWIRPGVWQFFVKSGEGFTVAIAATLVISLLFDALRTAVLSKWLFFEIGFAPNDFEGMRPEAVPALQAAIDEVQRLHQFYSALFFFLPLIYLEWLFKEWRWLSWVTVVGSLVAFVLAWRVLAVTVLDKFEHLHRIGRGILKKELRKKPITHKARIIGLLFRWRFWKSYGVGNDIAVAETGQKALISGKSPAG